MTMEFYIDIVGFKEQMKNVISTLRQLITTGNAEQQKAQIIKSKLKV
jgi:hypothetical protein